TYWFLIDGTKLLWFTALLLPLEMLLPVQKISFRKRIPHILYLLITIPIFTLIMKASCALALGMSFHDGTWLSSDQIPRPRLDFLPRLNLAPLLDAVPFPAAVFAVITVFVSD